LNIAESCTGLRKNKAKVTDIRHYSKYFDEIAQNMGYAGIIAKKRNT
jgi:hypothetical protein